MMHVVITTHAYRRHIVTEPYGHSPAAADPAWQRALKQFRDLLDGAGTHTVVILTRQVGRRPHDADGEYGAVLFAQTAQQFFRDQQHPEQDWLITYNHEGRFFAAVRRGQIALLNQQLNQLPSS